MEFADRKKLSLNGDTEIKEREMTLNTLVNAAVLIFLVIALWLAGFVASLWVGLGVLAMTAIIVMIQQLPELQRAALWIFVGWAIMFLVLPTILSHFPYTREGLLARHRLMDMIAGERVHPPMGDAFIEVKVRCDDWEREYTNQLAFAYNSLSEEEKPLIRKEIEAIRAKETPPPETTLNLDKIQRADRELGARG